MKKIVNRIAKSNDYEDIKISMIKEMTELLNQIETLQLAVPSTENDRLMNLSSEMLEISAQIAAVKVAIAQFSYKLGIETFVHSEEELLLAQKITEQQKTVGEKL